MTTYKGNKSLPPALVLDLSATGVAVARMLASHGVDVYGAEARVDSIGNYSKYIKKPSFGFNIELNDAFLSSLIDFSRQFDTKPVLIPADDTFIEFISEHFNLLSEHFFLQGSLSIENSPKFLNKKYFYQLCEKYDVSYPKLIFAHGGEGIDDILAQLRLPIILKPNLIHKWKKYLKGKKIILMETIQELETVLRDHKDILEDSMLQEVVPGNEDQIFLFKGYFGKDGKLKASFTGRKIRQYPPNFGSASLAESVLNEEVERISVEFLEAVKFHGLCGSEFKYDERDGVYKMIEINIRPQLWEDLTRIAEREIAWVAYCDMADIGVPELPVQKNGVKWVYVTRDIFSALWHIRNNNLTVSEWLRSYKGAKVDALIDFSDLRMLSHLPVYTFSQIYKYKIKPMFQGASL